MSIDLRRCAEAAARAALAEAFVRPEPRRRERKRRLRPLRALMRAVRLALAGVGAWTVVRTLRDPEFRQETVDALAERFPVEEFLEELALEVEAARAAMTGQGVASAPEAGRATGADGANDSDGGNQRRRRPVTRRRGDTNGQRGRKPPNRGTRA